MPTTKTIASDPLAALWAALVSIMIDDGQPPHVAIPGAGKMIARFGQLRQTGEKETLRLGDVVRKVDQRRATGVQG